MEKEKLLTAVEVSQLLGISRLKAYLLIRQKEIPITFLVDILESLRKAAKEVDEEKYNAED